jgi:hypothetical protein
MHIQTISEESHLTEPKEHFPSVSVVLPFEPKMTAKTELEYRQKAVVSKIEKELMANYPSGRALPVIKKLQQLCKNLNYATHKQSIALFVSPDTEKIVYLNIPVEEKVVVDAPFHIRDLVNCKQQAVEYLVFLLSARQSKMYLGNKGGLRLIKSNTPENVYAYLNEVPEKTANFSDPSSRRETMLDKFLLHMDEGLSVMLKAYLRPVFVIGDSRVAGHFAKITRHGKNIAAYIHKNCQDSSEEELKSSLQPYIADWMEVRQQNILRQVEDAVNTGKGVFGIEDVGKTAKYRNNRLLVVEKGFTAPGQLGSPAMGESKESISAFYIGDAVDSIMQQVLENGGDVEWV